MKLHEAGILDDVVQLAFAGRTRRLRQLLIDRMQAVALTTSRSPEEDAE